MIWPWKMRAFCSAPSIDTMAKAGHLSKSNEVHMRNKTWRLFHPSRNNNLTVKNLKYLNLHQALADVAHFIRYQKSQSANLTHSKVILIGGSYSGSMAAWMTHLYPELVAAVWASSAPVLAKADFYGKQKFVFYSLFS